MRCVRVFFETGEGGLGTGANATTRQPQQSQTRSRAGSVSQAQLEQQRTTRRGTNLSAIGNVPSSDAEGAVDVVVPPKCDLSLFSLLRRTC